MSQMRNEPPLGPEYTFQPQVPHMPPQFRAAIEKKGPFMERVQQYIATKFEKEREHASRQLYPFSPQVMRSAYHDKIKEDFQTRLEMDNAMRVMNRRTMNAAKNASEEPVSPTDNKISSSFVLRMDEDTKRRQEAFELRCKEMGVDLSYLNRKGEEESD